MRCLFWKLLGSNMRFLFWKLLGSNMRFSKSSYFIMAYIWDKYSKRYHFIMAWLKYEISILKTLIFIMTWLKYEISVLKLPFYHDMAQTWDFYFESYHFYLWHGSHMRQLFWMLPFFSWLSSNTCLLFQKSPYTRQFKNEITIHKVPIFLIKWFKYVFVWFGLNITFNNLSVILWRCLDVAVNSMLTFRVLPHWNIMPQTLRRFELTSSSSTFFMLSTKRKSS